MNDFTTRAMHNADNTIGRIYCAGYVFHMSDGSRFLRTDVESVEVQVTPTRRASTLMPYLGVKRKRTFVSMDEDYPEAASSSTSSKDTDDNPTFHMCDESGVVSESGFQLGDKCASWTTLSQDQKEALMLLQKRVDVDRAERIDFTCAIIEGPGGCGKTRIMSHLMNHSKVNSLVLYVAKQNKRVQDFICTDCTSGEPDTEVTQPVDMTQKKADEIYGIVSRSNSVGRFAVTAEKLVYALTKLSPKEFSRDATVSSLRIENGSDSIKRGFGTDPLLTGYDSGDAAVVETDTEVEQARRCPGCRPRGADDGAVKRTVIVLMDEYTMLQPPLIHAIIYYLRVTSESPLILVMGGDKYQCGPVGWDDRGDNPNEYTSLGKCYYTSDVRLEINAKIDYVPLELPMEKIKRCRGDPALGVCIKRLRNVCGEGLSSRTSKNMVNRILAMYCLESGVALYVKSRDTNGLFSINRVVPTDVDSLNACLSAGDFDERVALTEDEDLDTRAVEFALSAERPLEPMYDILPLVRHYTDLFVRLAETCATVPVSAYELWPGVIYESVARVRHLFPVVLVLTNTLCNTFAETFLLALSTKVRECVLATPLPARLSDKMLPQTWTGHLRYTLRRCIRSVTIDHYDAIRRQTLFLGMVYKMTSTMHAGESIRGLCNGETVVLTSIVFDNNALDLVDSVMLRKLDRSGDVDLVMRTGYNENRMTGARKMGILPFVPYVSENIYQMQGNTIGRNARSYVDVANAPCRSAYVAVSRFQDSASIQGIIIGE